LPNRTAKSTGIAEPVGDSSGDAVRSGDPEGNAAAVGSRVEEGVGVATAPAHAATSSVAVRIAATLRALEYGRHNPDSEFDRPCLRAFRPTALMYIAAPSYPSAPR